MKKAGIHSLFLGLAVFSGLVAVHAQAQAQTVGLFLNDEASFDGYTLFAPNGAFSTYLIDNHGKRVRSWLSGYRPGQSAYLLENGNLLRTAQYAPPGVPRFQAGGQGGRVEEYTWDGSLLWGYDYSNYQYRQHHDVERLPNGNVLVLAWEYKSYSECIAAGRSPLMITQGELWPDHIVEVAPLGTSGGDIVWEWHAWDHLVQDYDAAKDNYGVAADHPELVDVNFSAIQGPQGSRADWLHINAVDYNEDLDQIVLSVHNFSEIWVVDHSTTTAEASGHTGGNSGMGGDLLYRWGNPEAYGSGDSGDRELFAQHDSQWIESDCPGAENMLIFNNGGGRPGGNHSSVDEIEPPVDEYGDYELEPGEPYGPAAVLWSYTADPLSAFYAQNVSGAQRLPNGNTLICDGPHGTFFEVTPTMETAWKYVNPIGNSGPIAQGSPAQNNIVFRAYRYGPDYPAFAGKDLTAGDPLELYTRPLPAPGGEGATEPMTGSRITVGGDRIRVGWDTGSCPADDYNLIFGDLADVSTHTTRGAECAIGVLGTHDWLEAPAGDLFFLVVGVDDTGLYESSWGTDSSGAERNGSAPSNMCGVTTQDVTETCP